MWRLLVVGFTCLSLSWNNGEARADVGIEYVYWGGRVELKLKTSVSFISWVTLEQEGDQLTITEEFSYGPDWVRSVAMPDGWLTIEANATSSAYITIKNVASANLDSISVIDAQYIELEDVLVESLYATRSRILDVRNCIIDRLQSSSKHMRLEDSMFGAVTHYGRMRATYLGTQVEADRVNVARSFYIYGTNNADTIRFDRLRRSSRSQSPEVKMYLYNHNDWVSARNSLVRSLYIHGGAGSDSLKDEGGNNTPFRRPTTTSVEYFK